MHGQFVHHWIREHSVLLSISGKAVKPWSLRVGSRSEWKEGCHKCPHQQAVELSSAYCLRESAPQLNYFLLSMLNTRHQKTVVEMVQQRVGVFSPLFTFG